MSLLMREKIGLRDSTTHHDLYVFALLRFDFAKNSIRIVSFLLVFIIVFIIVIKRYYCCH